MCYSRPVFFFPAGAIILTAKEVGGSDCAAHPITGTEKETRGGTDLASLLQPDAVRKGLDHGNRTKSYKKSDQRVSAVHR